MRLPDWKERLQAEIIAAESRAWAYGHHDCLQLVARCALAMTGENPAQEFAYDDQVSAEVILTARDGIAGLLTHAFGPPVSPNECLKGDAVTAVFDGELRAGVCMGMTCAFAAPRGLTHRDRSVIIQGWRID